MTEGFKELKSIGRYCYGGAALVSLMNSIFIWQDHMDGKEIDLGWTIMCIFVTLFLISTGLLIGAQEEDD